MIGGAADCLGPAAFALGQVGSVQQFRQRKDTSQRRSDVVREAGERNFDRV